MVRLEETIVVARPLADCFRYLADFSTIEQWDPGVVPRAQSHARRGRGGFDLRARPRLGRRVRSPITYTLKELVPGARLVLEGIANNRRTPRPRHP